MADYNTSTIKNLKEKYDKKPEKKFKKVVSGSAKMKKKGELKKLSEKIIAGDLSDVKDKILEDVTNNFVTAAKNILYDAVDYGLKSLLFGSAVANSRKPSGSRIDYSGVGKYIGRSQTDYTQPQETRRGLDYDRIRFATRADAEIVLTTMEEAIDVYGMVAVSDLYEMADVSTNNFAANNYGWRSLQRATITHMPDGWMIKFPKAMPLN